MIRYFRIRKIDKEFKRMHDEGFNGSDGPGTVDMRRLFWAYVGIMLVIATVFVLVSEMHSR